MKRPVILIVGAAAGAFLLAAIGASAHAGHSPSKVLGVQSVLSSDEATGTQTQTADTPEATETPEAPATAEPADTDTDTDTDEDTDTETDDDNGAAAAAATTKHESADQETGDHQSATNKEPGD